VMKKVRGINMISKARISVTAEMNHPGVWIMGDLAMRLRRSGSPLTSLGQCAAVLNTMGAPAFFVHA
jgi:hypothetical protein